MGANRVVLLLNGRAQLFLSRVNWLQGKPIGGWVENGYWSWSVKDGEEFAGDERSPVNRRPAKQYEVVEVTEDIRGDYNDVMYWAETQSKFNRMIK